MHKIRLAAYSHSLFPPNPSTNAASSDDCYIIIDLQPVDTGLISTGRFAKGLGPEWQRRIKKPVSNINATVALCTVTNKRTLTFWYYSFKAYYIITNASYYTIR